MYSFDFPEMLKSASSRLISDRDAIRSNLKLLLGAEKLSLFGDPFFGSSLKKVLFEQSRSIVKDLLIDEIYTTIITFMPQVYLTRKDIKLTTDGTDIFASITYIDMLDNVSDLYNINLTATNTAA